MSIQQSPVFYPSNYSMPLVRLDKVALNFGTHILLDEVDFTLKKGSKIGLLGRNGAGKTTFMKVIAGSGCGPAQLCDSVVTSLYK